MPSPKLLLSRYKSALKHKNYFQAIINIPYGEMIKKLQQLYLAKLAYDSKENREQAVRDWLENMEFYNRAITGKVSLIELSVLMVNRDFAQKVLPEILGHDSLIAQKYQKELLSALRPISAKDTHPKHDIKLAYYLSDPLFRI